MAAIETGIPKTQIVNELTRSAHGDLKAYLPVGKAAVGTDPEFLAHMIAWNLEKGQIRDSKVALPVIFLSGKVDDAEFRDNALACLATLDPKNLMRAWRFAKEIKLVGNMMAFRRMVEAYLRARENRWGWWERVALQHRQSMKGLYAALHVKPSPMAEQILFKGLYPPGSIFFAVANLANMGLKEAAGTILEKKIPFLIAAGALGSKMKEPDLVMALIESMSATELVTNSKMLERLGVTSVPALRAAYEEKLATVASSGKNILKTSKAIAAVQDQALRDKLGAAQEKQITKSMSIEGNWLVLGDKSGSMQHAIELTRHVMAAIVRAVKGNVYGMFFDVTPRYFNATGKTLEQIQEDTKRITAGGGTSIGCGLQAALDGKYDVDGIVVVSDGGENSAPVFADVYKRYSAFLGKEVPVYFFHMQGESDRLSYSMRSAGIDFQVFDLTHGQVDYYSLPDLVRTMRSNRYSLIQEIGEYPLLTLNKALKLSESAAA